MAGPKDQMAAGEIEDRFTSVESGDKVRIVAGGDEYIGTVTYADNNVRDGGKASVGIDIDNGNVSVTAPIAPAEPNVGISSPYIEEVKFEGDGKAVLVDAMQVWSDKYDDWL